MARGVGASTVGVLCDLHGHVAAWHEQLRETITDQQWLPRIKYVWHTLPSYPSRSVAWEIYTAVLRDGVHAPE
jgi:hypothetical protein